MNRPYVGMTGFRTQAELAPILEYLRNSPFEGLGYEVMFGFTSSNKRLEDTQSEGKTSPKAMDLVALNLATMNYLPMIHYFTDNPANLGAELTQITDMVGCYNVQINQEWPDWQQIPNTIHRAVIQIPNSALKSQIAIGRSAAIYGAAYVLIDPSGGTGADFDLEMCKRLIPELEYHCPRSVIGVAGGIGPDNVEERYSQIDEIANRPFCIDAQGKLRTNGSLDPAKAIAYLKGAVRAISA